MGLSSDGEGYLLKGTGYFPTSTSALQTLLDEGWFAALFSHAIMLLTVVVILFPMIYAIVLSTQSPQEYYHYPPADDPWLHAP